MIELSRGRKVGVAVAATAVLMLFTHLGPDTLLGMIVGAVLILLGLASYSRLASTLGIMIVSISAAASLPQRTMTDAGNIFSLTAGFLTPLCVLVLLSLSAENEKSTLVGRRPAAWALAYSAACILSVPASTLVLGIMVPWVSTAMSTLMEIAVVLLVATTGMTVLSLRSPRRAAPAETRPGSEP